MHPTSNAVYVPATISVIDAKADLGEFGAFYENASGTNRARIVNRRSLSHVQRPLRVDDAAVEAMMRLAKRSHDVCDARDADAF
jgi:hypothetical protein